MTEAVGVEARDKATTIPTRTFRMLKGKSDNLEARGFGVASPPALKARSISDILTFRVVVGVRMERGSMVDLVAVSLLGDFLVGVEGGEGGRDEEELRRARRSSDSTIPIAFLTISRAVRMSPVPNATFLAQKRSAIGCSKAPSFSPSVVSDRVESSTEESRRG